MTSKWMQRAIEGMPRTSEGMPRIIETMKGAMKWM
jgi:hypothetical protein